MICHRCLVRMRACRTASLSPSILSSKTIDTTTISSRLPIAATPFTLKAHASTTAAPRGPAFDGHERRDTATSTSAAKPFSTPLSSKPHAPAPNAVAEPKVKSSCEAGTLLTGLGYFKGKDPPRAMEDQEYPAWLWDLLEGGEKKATGEAEDTGDAYAKSKKQRRLAAKAALKAAKARPSDHAPKVPLEQQSIDLQAGDGSVDGSVQAVRVRAELTEAMRNARRKNIKETNFLKTMR